MDKNIIAQKVKDKAYLLNIKEADRMKDYARCQSFSSIASSRTETSHNDTDMNKYLSKALMDQCKKQGYSKPSSSVGKND